MVNGRLGYLGETHINVTTTGGGGHSLDPSTIPSGHVMVSNGTEYVSSAIEDHRLPGTSTVDNILVSDGSKWVERADPVHIDTVNNSMSIGDGAGTGLPPGSTAIGNLSGQNQSGENTTTIGYYAGDGAEVNATVIGAYAGTGAKQNSVTIGTASGPSGAHSLSLGYAASAKNTRSIVINASGLLLESDDPNKLFINPIASGGTYTSDLLCYNTSTSEVVHITYEEMKLSSVDPDVSAFIIKVPDTTDIHKVAYRDYILKLKGDGLWDKLKCGYVFDRTNPYHDIKGPKYIAQRGEYMQWFDDGLHMCHYHDRSAYQYALIPFNMSTETGPLHEVTILDCPMMDMEVGYSFGGYETTTASLTVKYDNGSGVAEMRAFDNADDVINTAPRKSELGQIYSWSNGNPLECRRNHIVMESKQNTIVESTPPNTLFALGGISRDATGTLVNNNSRYKTSQFMIFDRLFGGDMYNAYDAVKLLKHNLKQPYSKESINNNIVLQGDSLTDFENSRLYRTAMMYLEPNFNVFEYIGRGGKDPEEMVVDNFEEVAYKSYAKRNVVINFGLYNMVKKAFLANSGDSSLTTSACLTAVENWVTHARSKGYDIVVFSTMVWGRETDEPTFTLDPWYDIISDVNDTLLANAGKIYGDYLLDVRDYKFYRPKSDYQTAAEYRSAAESAVQNTSYFAADQVHPTDNGFKALGELIGPQIKSILEY
eukprot:TRINITY_DN3446_c0_g1_i1.p1 TRINITY_DN3446_c0_g1~~TRINITY_DN3446_c0_g1_i1.p1  ORF type:complete len:710 (+),score=17.09 TRINITY_DN3446_c0_g1_i1:317-2446(+)